MSTLMYFLTFDVVVLIVFLFATFCRFNPTQDHEEDFTTGNFVCLFPLIDVNNLNKETCDYISGVVYFIFLKCVLE